MVDNDKLISMVKERKPLWDIKNKNYHNRDIARKLWQEIAEELDTTGTAVKSRWQNLRDIFRREHAKSTKPPDGGLPVLSTWKYYDQLLFIAEMFTSKKGRPSIGSLSNQVPQQADIKSEDEEMLVPMCMVDVEVSNGGSEVMDIVAVSGEEELQRSASSKLINNQMNRKSETRGETEATHELLQLEMRMMEQLERIQKMRKSSKDFDLDEDYHFLMSLLPHLRDIPKNRKLSARMRLQQVLLEETDLANQ